MPFLDGERGLGPITLSRRKFEARPRAPALPPSRPAIRTRRPPWHPHPSPSPTPNPNPSPNPNPRITLSRALTQALCRPLLLKLVPPLKEGVALLP